jgi:V/A-type H+-transporting ATPase subunit D
MASLIATRMELLAKKAQLALAEQGQDLLEQKRLALLRELRRIVDQVLAGREQLQAAAVAAQRALARSAAFAGGEAVRSAAMATRAELTLDVQRVNVMGVSVPTIERRRVTRSVLNRGYALPGTSVTIDEAAGAFEAEVDQLLELAESELRLTRLAAEIQRTSRRANALEYVVIPRLAAERNAIRMALDERERADHFRLKRIKHTLEQRRSTGWR